MTFEEWMGSGYSDRMTGMEALRAAYEAGRKAGISAVPDAEGPRKLNVLDDELSYALKALRLIASAIPPDGDHTRIATVSELRDYATNALLDLQQGEPPCE